MLRSMNAAWGGSYARWRAAFRQLPGRRALACPSSCALKQFCARSADGVHMMLPVRTNAVFLDGAVRSMSAHERPSALARALMSHSSFDASGICGSLMGTPIRPCCAASETDLYGEHHMTGQLTRWLPARTCRSAPACRISAVWNRWVQSQWRMFRTISPARQVTLSSWQTASLSPLSRCIHTLGGSAARRLCMLVHAISSQRHTCGAACAAGGAGVGAALPGGAH
jgi:hypothetical protein